MHHRVWETVTWWIVAVQCRETIDVYKMNAGIMGTNSNPAYGV